MRNAFNFVSGYGYDDYGRDTLEKVYASVFHTESALVRPQVTCGTHALALALGANLRPGDELLSVNGKPYDTLEEVIGIRPSNGSLAEYGVSYRQVDLLEDGSFDFDKIKTAINEKTKMVAIQRSKGYQTRPSFSVAQIGEVIRFVKEIKPEIICMVDNCYGEFVEDQEPSDVGADMVVGSLIKNPGGGLGSDWWIYCRKRRFDRSVWLPSDISGTGKRSGGISWRYAVLLSGSLSCTNCCGKCFKGSHPCGKYLRASRL